MKKVTELPENYWDAIMDWLPNYYHRNDVLKSDILQRYVDDEEVDKKDLDWLPESKEEAQKELFELDLDLYNQAMKAKEAWTLHIESLDDVRLFFKFLVEDWKLNFHPDTPFEDYINFASKNPTFDAEECVRYNAVMEQCFKFCIENDADIYELACEALPSKQPANDASVKLSVLTERKRGYYDQYYKLNNEVKEKIAEVLGDRTVNLEDGNYYVTIIERHCGETYSAQIESISSHSFKTSEGECRLEEMSLEDLCVVLDYLITGEW